MACACGCASASVILTYCIRLEDGWHGSHRKRGRWMEKHTERHHGGAEERISLKGWLGCCVTGHIERGRTYVAQTGAVATATD